MAPKAEYTTIEAAGREIRISSPSKVYFPVGAFLDYNQNARDRTVASAYSVRPVPDARVSAPLHWDEVADVEPEDLRMDTVPDRIERDGDPAADIDEHAGRLDALLDLARRDEEGGLGDAPWPPHFAKQAGEPKRVQPSKAKQAS
jgi:DNA primase